jgi:hypothetical protein
MADVHRSQTAIENKVRVNFLFEDEARDNRDSAQAARAQRGLSSCRLHLQTSESIFPS